MMLKPERCWVVWILFSSVTKLSTNDYFQSRLYQKGEANGSRTFLQQVVLKPHEQANVFIQSSGATVKAVTASQVEYMLLNHSNEKVRPQTFRMKKVLFRGTHSLETTQQQTNA
jgi:hypothetical protein